MTTDSFGVGKWRDLTIGFDDALAFLGDALKEQGFGIITEIDVQRTFQAKLGLDFRRYRIIGACNPSFAHRALQTDLRVGILLPCNVVLYEKDDGKAVVGVIDPLQSFAAAEQTATLTELARDVGSRLESVLERVALQLGAAPSSER